MNFWANLPKPIVGLSPMDAITDYAFREVQTIYGRPDVLFTEFIPVEGLVRLNPQLMRDFWYSSAQQPVVAQIYGNDPELFYFAAQIVAELGFSGLDLNMGCPARSVVHRGCGAALINNPDLAKKLIFAAQAGIEDWATTGISWEKWPVFSEAKARQLWTEFLRTAKEKEIDYPVWDQAGKKREKIPISVKTRVGYQTEVIADWLPVLLSTKLAAITLHGRTLKQLYSGKADWDLIAKAVAIRDQSPGYRETLILGNGDIKSVSQARELIDRTGVDGVLVGRATFGNPWLLGELAKGVKNTTSISELTSSHSFAEVKAAMLKHSQLHETSKGSTAFVQMRKILCWYIKDIPNASQLRAELVQTNSAAEVQKVLDKWNR